LQTFRDFPVIAFLNKIYGKVAQAIQFVDVHVKTVRIVFVNIETITSLSDSDNQDLLFAVFPFVYFFDESPDIGLIDADGLKQLRVDVRSVNELDFVFLDDSSKIIQTFSGFFLIVLEALPKTRTAKSGI
jgi:hypothetical protein